MCPIKHSNQHPRHIIHAPHERLEWNLEKTFSLLYEYEPLRISAIKGIMRPHFSIGVPGNEPLGREAHKHKKEILQED